MRQIEIGNRQEPHTYLEKAKNTGALPTKKETGATKKTGKDADNAADKKAKTAKQKIGATEC